MSRPLIPVKTTARAFMLGALWGWLPCGMVYAALLLALSSASAPAGAGVMLIFALGTLPSLAAVGYVARRLRYRPENRRLRRVAGFALAAAGGYGLIQLALHAASLHDWCVL
jgi:hypothetical protein